MEDKRVQFIEKWLQQVRTFLCINHIRYIRQSCAFICCCLIYIFFDFPIFVVLSISVKSGKTTRSEKAGLQFPVGRIHRHLRKGKLLRLAFAYNITTSSLMQQFEFSTGNYAARIGSGAAVYLTGVLEYILAEVIELAGNATIENKRNRIIPRYIMLAIQNDEELKELFKGATISGGGVVPHIEGVLLPKKTSKKGNDVAQSQEY